MFKHEAGLILCSNASSLDSGHGRMKWRVITDTAPPNRSDSSDPSGAKAHRLIPLPAGGASPGAPTTA